MIGLSRHCLTLSPDVFVPTVVQFAGRLEANDAVRV